MNRTVLQIFLLLAFIPLAILVGYGVLVVAPIFCCFLAINSYKFKNFNEAFSFMTSIAIFADKINHHPEWFNVYSRVDVVLTTHDLNGVSELDITLAEHMDNFASNFLLERV